MEQFAVAPETRSHRHPMLQCNRKAQSMEPDGKSRANWHHAQGTNWHQPRSSAVSFVRSLGKPCLRAVATARFARKQDVAGRHDVAASGGPWLYRAFCGMALKNCRGSVHHLPQCNMQ